jgi:hypothetical protein
MRYYSAIKKNEILSFTGKWMELENFMLSEVSQVQKDKCCMFSIKCGRKTQVQVQAPSCIQFPTVGLLEETKGGGKEQNNRK